jgi:hypothetical protein
MGDGGDLRNYNQQPTLNKCCIIYALKLFSAAWVRVWLCKLQKRCIRLPATSDNVYHLLFRVLTPLSAIFQLYHGDQF